MSLVRFFWCIVEVLMGIFIVYGTPARSCFQGIYKTDKREVVLSVFIFQLIGYIINFLVLIAVIVFYCLNIDISEYVLYFIFGEIIVAFFFAVAIDRIYK